MDTESVDTSVNALQKLEYDDVLDLLKKYGYSSASSHPYIYQNGDDLGICYSYRDAEYGTLERIKLFEDKESVEEFLKQMQWLEKNGPMYHVRMSLDNYETVYPRILFLRKERLMVPGEMDDIETYDFNEQKRENLDDTSRLLYEAGDLLIVYDEIKARQLAYINNLTVLKNTLRQKYYDLQLEVDKYNRIGKIERNVSFVPTITDDGIDLTMEIAIKDRYNQYVAQIPSYDDVLALVKDIWELNKNLELNNKYYEVQIEDNSIRNEIKVVEAKLEYMKELNDDVRPLFSEDLVSKFKKINREFAKKSNEITNEFIQNKLQLVEKKYSVFDQIHLLDLSEYLREGFTNTNYDDMVLRYSKNRVRTKVESIRLPLNEVASNLSVQYKEKLDIGEQAILILHNNPKYREIFDAILQVDNFDTISVKQVIKKINNIKGFSKLKSECFYALKKRIDDPVNANIKKVLFQNVNFTSFETFIGSFIPLLVKLKNMNGRMVLNSDINMYSLVNKVDDLLKEKFTFITNDLDTLYVLSQNKKCNIALILLKKDLPVLYAPYTFDLGDIYTKGGSPQMYIKEYVGFDLLVEHDDMNIIVSEDKINVVNYQSEKEVVENLTTATSLYNAYKTTFCKIMFLPKEVELLDVPVEEPVSVSQVPQEPIVMPVPVPASVEPTSSPTADSSEIPVPPVLDIQPEMNMESPQNSEEVPKEEKTTDNEPVTPELTQTDEPVLSEIPNPFVLDPVIETTAETITEETTEVPTEAITVEHKDDIKEDKEIAKDDLPEEATKDLDINSIKEESQKEKEPSKEDIPVESKVPVKEEKKVIPNTIESKKEESKDSLDKEVLEVESSVKDDEKKANTNLVVPNKSDTNVVKKIDSDSGKSIDGERKVVIGPDGKKKIIIKKVVSKSDVSVKPNDSVKPVTPVVHDEIKKEAPKVEEVTKKNEEASSKPIEGERKVVIGPDGKKKVIIKKVVSKPDVSVKPNDSVKPVTPVVHNEIKKEAPKVEGVAKKNEEVPSKPIEGERKVVIGPDGKKKVIIKKVVSKTDVSVKPNDSVKPVTPVVHNEIKKEIPKTVSDSGVVKTKVVVTSDGKKIVKKVIVKPAKPVQSIEKPVQSNIVKKVSEPVVKGKE